MKKKSGIEINREYQNNLRLANDFVPMSESTDEPQQMTLKLQKKCQKVGLQVNMKKLK